MPLAQVAVRDRADLSLETGRTLDIAEQERDRPVVGPVGGRVAWVIGRGRSARGSAGVSGRDFGQLAQAAGELAQDRECDGRLLGDDGFELPRGQGEADRRFDGSRPGGSRTPVEDGQLAEEVAWPENSHPDAVADHLDRPLTTM